MGFREEWGRRTEGRNNMLVFGICDGLGCADN